jgi:5-methylcytosine-specific restriction endonuclease McrA
MRRYNGQKRCVECHDNGVPYKDGSKDFHSYRYKLQRQKNRGNRKILALLNKLGFTECKKCGSKENLTVDHIIPLSKGGTNDWNNLQTLCFKCNHLKADKLTI